MTAAVDVGLRVIGLAFAAWASAMLAVLGAFLTPWRVGGTLVPIALLIAVAGPVLVMRFAHLATGWRLATVAVGLIWIAVTLAAVDSTTEGDLVLSQQWVALTYLFLSPVVVAVTAYRLIVPPLPPRLGIG